MPLDKATILRQIDEALAQYENAEETYAQPDEHSNETYLAGLPGREFNKIRTLLMHTIERFRPEGTSAYGNEVLERRSSDYSSELRRLAGILSALRDDHVADRLHSLRELIHADVFADLLEQAEHLLDQGYKDAAAVTCGAVLEEHLRKLCVLHAIPTTTTDAAGKSHPKKLDTMNIDLVKAGCYNTIEQKDITTQAGIRNAAAHGEYAKYTVEQVQQMIGSVRSFIIRHPA